MEILENVFNENRVLFFRTAQSPICEKALDYISQMKMSVVDFFGNVDYPRFSFRKRYIVSYNGFLEVHKIPAATIEELRSRNYHTVVFPYTVKGWQSYRNLLKVAAAIHAEEVILINELGVILRKKVSQFLFQERLRLLVLMVTLLPMMALINFWFIRDFFRLKRNAGKLYRVTSNTHVIGGTTDIEFSKEPSLKVPSQCNRIRVGCIARLDPIKGHVYLLEALSLIVKETPDVELILIGGGPELPKLQEYAGKLEISQFVRFEGMQQDIRKYLQECDIFVLPSLNEAMPISIIEVFAARRPIVATRVGGIPNIILDEHNGLLVDSQSAEQICSAIWRLIRDPELYMKIAENGYICFKDKHSPAAMGKKYLDVYSDLKINRGSKIWLCSSFDLNWIGGLNKYVEIQSKLLSNNGFNVEIRQPANLHFNTKCDLGKYILRVLPNVLGIHKEIIDTYVRKLILGYLLLKNVFLSRPDVINVHDVVAYAAFNRICRWLKIPLVLTKHGDLAKEVRLQHQCEVNSYLYQHMAEIEKYAYSKAQCLIAVDEESMSRFQKGLIVS
ncbi:glycosyltransferase [Cohnella caldifontis]|uniref:glycosyltransferase n=1 Tax=Cohnella caldifontis TaxID=3027471 RepID=UPI0023EA9EBB|nr:glycosyltransferase [Cohnella sp. YIM B05605]